MLVDLDSQADDGQVILVKCAECPREGQLRLKSVINFGVGSPFLIENMVLCEYCAMIRDDVL